ncbi:MAG: sulfotransferase [Bacteroidetes bacterium]|nr:sulfotransferase [Bacteroidota bacterium]
MNNLYSMKNTSLAKRSLEIHQINSHVDNSSLFTHCQLDTPGLDSLHTQHTLHITGWISPIEKLHYLQLNWGNHILDRDLELSNRQDVADYFQEESLNCGFEFFCNIYTLSDCLPLKIEAVMIDGTQVELVSIKFTIHSTFKKTQKGIQPCLLMSMDRSGSTFLVNLLDKHQSLLCYPHYPFEAWAVHYWMRNIINQTSPLDVTTPGDSRFWETKQDNLVSFHNRSLFGSYQQDSKTLDWLCDSYPNQVAQFSHEAIISFYESLREATGKKKPCYFLEKVRPTIEALLFRHYRPETKQIILVRDFRDYTCSYLSFFGLSPYSSKEEMIVKKIGPTIWRLYECYLSCKETSLLVFYEDLVLNTSSVLEKILTYLNIKTDSKTTSLMYESTETGNAAVKNSHVTSKNIHKSIGRWKYDLEPELVDLLEETIKDPMEYFFDS